MKLADKITREVYSEFQAQWQLHSKYEMNREIKKRMRECLQRESINSMIEIIDMEAKFIRAPFQIVIEKIQKQVSSYVKHCTEMTLKQQSSIATLKKSLDVDNLESPFDMTERYVKIINLLNSSFEIQRFVNHKVPSTSQLARYLGVNKVFNQGSIQYFLNQEANAKFEQALKYKEYMVQIGLLTQREFERFKTKSLGTF